jgi:hypothetical protein
LKIEEYARAMSATHLDDTPGKLPMENTHEKNLFSAREYCNKKEWFLSSNGIFWSQ